MTTLKRTCLAALLALVLPALAWSTPQQNIEDSRPVSADMTLEIDDIIVGSITVIGWDQNEMSVTGTIGDDIDDFVIEGGPDHVEISADFDGRDYDYDDDDSDDEDRGERRRWRGRQHDDVDVKLEIYVPRGASLEIEGVTANFDVTGVNGDIEIESVTGNIKYEGSARSIDVAVVTGSITVRSSGVRSGSFESVQGSLYFEGSVAAGAELDFETVMGSVDLLLPADVSAEFDIETMTGEIENAFGEAPRSTNRWLPSKELSFSTGGGSAEISIETLQGKVTLRMQ